MPSPGIRHLSQKIRQYFETGILPGPDVRHYIASTFSHPTAREFQAVLNDPDNCERETLLELIFFPDLEVQIALEQMIASGRFQKNAETELLQHLMQPPTVAAVRYPDRGRPVRVVVPEDKARQFIVRLRIHTRLPGSLLAAIGHTLPEETRLQARVMVRNALFTCRGAKADFVEAFFLGLGSQVQPFFEHLAFVLRFLETAPPENSLKTALATLKQQYRKHLFKAGQFERIRANRNVETLIMQGIRIPHCDPGDAMQKIAMLDTVSLAIYGEIL